MRFTTTIFALAVLAVSTQAIETAASGDADATKILIYPITHPEYYPVPYRPPKVYPRSELSTSATAPQSQGESKIAINSDDVDYEDENDLDEEGNDKFMMPYYRRRWWGRRPYWYRPYRYRRYRY